MTLDEARLMANVNARAQRLFADGYRARWRGPHLLAVASGLGAVYEVDTRAGTCTCPFFLRSGHPCKHALGWRRLLARQRVCRLWIAVTLLRAWGSLDDAAHERETAPPEGDAANTSEASGPMPRRPAERRPADRRT